MTKKGKLEIWAQIQGGDKDAFDQVYHIHIDSLYNYGSFLTSDTQLIEDAIQEVFINIWTKRSTLYINNNIKGYLFTALRRQIITQIEKRKKTELKDDFIEHLTDQIQPLDSGDNRIDQVKKEISKLSKREREAIVLKYQEGLSYEEISILMNLKNQAIYKLVSRGVKKIRSNIKSGLFMFF